MTNQCLIGDCRDVLPTLEAGSVQMCVTSPPFWGLRSYGIGAENGELGLESTPEEYVANMVGVFREVKRVLRDDGTLWLNLGDSYATNRNDHEGGGFSEKWQDRDGGSPRPGTAPKRGWHGGPNLKPKDLCGIPWLVAFALRADGWVLRQEIIWSKPSPMPESVRDRCTKSHEQIFLFAKAKWRGPEGGRFAHISEQDARWLACCIDTEGCIVVKRVKQLDGGADSFGPQVAFSSTSRALMDRFVSIVGHGNLALRPGKNAPMHSWQVGNNIARDFLHLIYPHLIIKQRQARIGIYLDSLTYYRGGKFLSRKQRTPAENEILISLWARSKVCNRFGDPDLSDVPEPVYGRWADCERYFYDADAISEPADPANGRDTSTARRNPPPGMQPDSGFVKGRRFETRNKRSVWTVTTKPFSGAHFAVFPPELIEPCILAGSRPGDVVLDPFMGSGTTAQVAQALGRQWVGIELNSEYATLQRDRTAQLGMELV